MTFYQKTKDINSVMLHIHDSWSAVVALLMFQCLAPHFVLLVIISHLKAPSRVLQSKACIFQSLHSLIFEFLLLCQSETTDIVITYGV